jgi:hypothetical protein
MIALKVLVCMGLVISIFGDWVYSQEHELNWAENVLFVLDAAVKMVAIGLIM